MKTNTKLAIITGILGSMIIITYFQMATSYSDSAAPIRLILKDEKKQLDGIKDIIFKCADKQGLEEDAECFFEQVSYIYKYNETRDFIQLSFEELVERGGDCKDWTELYATLAIIKGYEAKKIYINAGPRSRHVYAVIYNEEGYCHLDQTRMFCFMYEN